MLRRLVAAACLAVPLGAATDRVLFSFELEGFEGWRTTGASPFGAGPVAPEADMLGTHGPEAPYRFSGWVGDRMVSQDIAPSKRRGIRPTEVPGGRLVSPPFTIDRDHLRFRLGGLLHPGVFVALVLEDDGAPQREGETWTLRRIAYANNRFDLVERGWDVREFRGRTARVQLVVEAANRVIFRADHFVLTDEPLPDGLLYGRSHWLDSDVLAEGKYHLGFDATRLAAAFANPSAVRLPDGTWHLFAVECKNDNGYFAEHQNLVYGATAPYLRGAWTTPEPVLLRDADAGERWIRYPVVAHDAATGRFAMLWWGSGGDGQPYGVHLAVSADGRRWTRPHAGPVFTHDFAPMPGTLRRIGDEWVLVYSNAGDESVHVDRARLFRRSSPDLLAWGEAREIPVASSVGQELGHSRPILFPVGERWFLLCNNRTSQQGRTRFLFTQVHEGRDPFAWDLESSYRGNLDAFTDPLVVEEDGGLHVVHWHPTSGGPWIARLRVGPPRTALFPPRWPGIPVGSAD